MHITYIINSFNTATTTSSVLSSREQQVYEDLHRGTTKNQCPLPLHGKCQVEDTDYELSVFCFSSFTPSVEIQDDSSPTPRPEVFFTVVESHHNSEEGIAYQINQNASDIRCLLILLNAEELEHILNHIFKGRTGEATISPGTGRAFTAKHILFLSLAVMLFKPFGL